MTVAVDLGKLKRQRREFGDGVLVLLADCPDPSAAEVVAVEADFGFASGEFKGLSPMKAGLAPSPAGPVFVLEPAPPQLWAWLEELARRLDARGLSGTLTAASPAKWEPWFSTRPPETWIGAAAYYPGWYYEDQPRWAWDDQVAHDVPRLAAQWCRQGAERAFIRAGILTEIQPTDLPDMIDMATKHKGLTQAWAGGPHPPRLRSINFNNRGFAGCLVNNDHSLTEQVEAVSALFSWHPELMSHAFIRRFYSTADPQFISNHDYGPFPLSPVAWSRPNNTHLIDRLVLDAHAIQLLTTAHLERATNLDAWTITETAPDRHLVKAKDLTPWLTDHAPDPDVLNEARHDFGKMIATPQLVEELKGTGA
jgi:hypothetical protein